ncbi:MAG TPA: hypothetical protein VG456_18620 [Candidatus Sulfopaludibacter sp.]|jgi:hypothetical protein|nr:hypothetical protein [Candidatus Sulfopaludibacter sp.]
MNIQFVRLDDQVCETVNQLALQQRRTVSDLVNEILRTHLLQDREKAQTGGE